MSHFDQTYSSTINIFSLILIPIPLRVSCDFFSVFFFSVSCLLKVPTPYKVYGTVLTMLHAAILRQNLQLKFIASPNHSRLTPYKPVLAMTLQCKAPSRADTKAPIFNSLVLLNQGKQGTVHVKPSSRGRHLGTRTPQQSCHRTLANYKRLMPSQPVQLSQGNTYFKAWA